VSLQLTEPVIAGLVNRLTNDLAAAIAAINAQAPVVADGYLIEQPQQVLDFFPPLSLLTVFPTVAVAEAGGSLTDDIGSAGTGDWQFAIRCYVQDPDQQALTRKLRRLRLACAQVVMNGRQVPDAPGYSSGGGLAAWGVRWLRLDPGQTLGEMAPGGGSVGMYMSWSGFVVECKDDDA
jgi:hypothetical protein